MKQPIGDSRPTVLFLLFAHKTPNMKYVYVTLQICEEICGSETVKIVQKHPGGSPILMLRSSVQINKCWWVCVTLMGCWDCWNVKLRVMDGWFRGRSGSSEEMKFWGVLLALYSLSSVAVNFIVSVVSPSRRCILAIHGNVLQRGMCECWPNILRDFLNISFLLLRLGWVSDAPCVVCGSLWCSSGDNFQVLWSVIYTVQ